jgi:hypothetical protein
MTLYVYWIKGFRTGSFYDNDHKIMEKFFNYHIIQKDTLIDCIHIEIEGIKKNMRKELNKYCKKNKEV